jgi:hypothetical protein
MKAYVARDNNGKLVIYRDRPKWLSNYGEWAPCQIFCKYMEIDASQLFECEPGQCIEVEVKIESVRQEVEGE